MKEVYVVRSCFYRWSRYPFIAIFGDQDKAKAYRDKLFDDYIADPSYSRSWIWVEAVELGKPREF